MKQIFDEGLINTKGSGLYDFTDQIHYFVKKNKLINGILNINILHTSASLIIQENADPDVLHDLNNFFKKLVPMDNNFTNIPQKVKTICQLILNLLLLIVI